MTLISSATTTIAGEPSPVKHWLAPTLSAVSSIRHGFTFRTGGVSVPPFDTLNLGLHVGDDPVCVVENRRRAASALGFDLSRMVCAAQVHGADVATVTEAEAGRGATVYTDALPDVDALVTDTHGLLLTLFFADCVPVFFAGVGASGQPVVGLAHAGWRGMASGVLENTVRVMKTNLGMRPDSLRVAIGPHIRAAHFEVGEEVARQFPALVVSYPNPVRRPHVDLSEAARLRLLAASVLTDQIHVSADCTVARADRYFSHRRDGGRTGRMAAMIGITVL